MTATHQNSGKPRAGAMLPLLRGLAESIPCDSIDELWIFPPRHAGAVESAVVVASAFAEGDGPPSDRRRIFSAHYTARHEAHGKSTSHNEITEHGAAPADRIGRLIEGVLRRLDDELAAQPPRSVRIGGDPSRWTALLDAIAAETPADEP